MSLKGFLNGESKTKPFLMDWHQSLMVNIDCSDWGKLFCFSVIFLVTLKMFDVTYFHFCLASISGKYTKQQHGPRKHELLQIPSGMRYFVRKTAACGFFLSLKLGCVLHSLNKKRNWLNGFPSSEHRGPVCETPPMCMLEKVFAGLYSNQPDVWTACSPTRFKLFLLSSHIALLVW